MPQRCPGEATRGQLTAVADSGLAADGDMYPARQVVDKGSLARCMDGGHDR